MNFTIEELRLMMDGLIAKHGTDFSDYSADQAVGPLQAKLSMMIEAKRRAAGDS